MQTAGTSETMTLWRWRRVPLKSLYLEDSASKYLRNHRITRVVVANSFKTYRNTQLYLTEGHDFIG